MNVRRLSVGDYESLQKCIDIAASKYPPFDRSAAYHWGCAALSRDDVAIFTTEACFAVAVVYQRFWAPAERYADLVLLCSGRRDKRSAGELLALAKAFKAWALSQGCIRLDFAPETGVDFGPLAKRVGKAEHQIGWMVRLDGQAGYS